MAHGTGALRALAAICHFMVFASATIVTGIISYLFSKYSFRGSHIVYQEVIAVFTMVVYLFAMFMPLAKTYGGFFLPVSFVFSYLWLTSFIFSATDWSGRLCREAALGVARCSLKRTVESFNFVALFFLVCNIVVEALLWRAHRRTRQDKHVAVKERPVSGISGNTNVSTPPVVQA